MRLGADMIALSFVRSADDIVDVHAIMDEFGFRVPVIAKIEKPQAVDNLEEIVRAFDGIMVARGDLGVEMPLEDVPLVQKRAIELARREAKPVIVATQVLESMIENARPTRAEASDAANAVLDGADALMLSGETSVGAYPIESVATMGRIIASTEEKGFDKIARMKTNPKTVGGAVTKAAVEIGDVVGAKFLITFTETGGSATRMSRSGPGCRSSPSRPTRRCARCSRSSGASRPTSCPGCTTPTSSRCRSTSTCCPRAASSRATASSSSPARPPASPARRTRCASTAPVTP